MAQVPYNRFAAKKQGLKQHNTFLRCENDISIERFNKCLNPEDWDLNASTENRTESIEWWTHTELNPY